MPLEKWRTCMFGIIFKNLIGYDMIIILMAIVNVAFIIPKLRRVSSELRNRLQGTVYLPLELILESVNSDHKNQLNLHELQELREKEVFFYHLFETINSIFPLLGILGTIISLLGMVGLESDIIMNNFTIALTSTFWGLIFAISFRAVDGMLAPKFYQNQENLQLIY